MTKPQILKEKLKTMIAFRDILHEDIARLARRHKRLSDEEIAKKYPGAFKRKIKPIKKVPF